MNKLKLALACMALAASQLLMAQTNLPSNVEVAQPKLLSGDRIYKSKTDAAIREMVPTDRGNGYWNVLSDRSMNTTYSGPSTSSGKFSALNFNEPVRIAKIQNGFALVYTDVQNSVYPEITKNAKTRGWVPLDKLLLWTRCPVDDYGIFDKAMTAVNLDQVDASQVDNILYGKNRMLFNPEDTTDSRGVGGQTIFFVMKEEMGYDAKGKPINRLLLSNSSRLEGLEVNNLAGWMEEVNVSRWTQRSCLERNTNARDLANRLKGESVTIYDNPRCERFKAQPWEHTFQPGDKRDDGSMLRFPILNNDTDNDNLYKVTVFGAIGSGQGARAARADAERRAEEAREALKRINIIIVIDGTTSMAPYYKPVQDAINTALTGPLKDYKVSVGAVIYRDKQDSEYITEYRPMSAPDDVALVNFLNKGGKYGIKSAPADKDKEESVLEGLNLALDFNKMGYNQNENNVILLIGDCGSRAPEFAAGQAEITRKLLDNNMQLLAFQTYNSGEGAYSSFRMQTLKLLRDNLRNQYKKAFGRDDDPKFPELPDQTGREFVHPENEDAFFMASLRYPQSEGVADPAIIGQMILNNITEFAKTAFVKFTAFNNEIYGYEVDDNSKASMNADFVRSMIGDQAYQLLKQQNSTMAVTGYAPKKNREGYDYWNPVVFISESELNNLLGDLKKVYEQAQKNGQRSRVDRNDYVNSLVGVVRAMLPNDVPTSEVMNLNLSQISQMINGLNVQTKATGQRDVSLTDLLDPKVVSDDDFTNYLYDFESKYDNLLTIRQHYDYTKEIGGVKYFWIPITLLP